MMRMAIKQGLTINIISSLNCLISSLISHISCGYERV